MPAIENILVIKSGTHSVKSVIYDTFGNEIASASQAVPLEIQNSFATQGFMDWERSFHATLRKVLSAQGVGSQTKLIAFTGTTPSLVAVDVKGRPIRAGSTQTTAEIITYLDVRAQREFLELAKTEEYSALLRSNGFSLHPNGMLPKIMWIRHHDPDGFKKVAKFLQVSDYLAFFFTRRFITDEYNAYQCFANPITKKPPAELLSRLGLSPDRFPEVVKVGTVISNINKEVARKFHISPEAKVVATAYDTICDMVGSGVANSGEANDSCGSTTSMKVVSQRRIIDAMNRIHVLPYPKKNLWIGSCSSFFGGLLLDWFRLNLFPKELGSFKRMDEYAKRSPFGARGIRILPYLQGERAPIWSSFATGVVFGLRFHHSICDVARACYETLGFISKQMQETFLTDGFRIDNYTLSGACNRNPQISKIKNMILRRPTRVVEGNSTESVGAMMLAAVAGGYFKDIDEAQKKMRRKSHSLKILADHETTSVYEKAFREHLTLYQHLENLFPKMVEE